MKKLLLSVAVLATVASCSKNEVSDVDLQSQGDQITFTTLNDRVMTKAANDAAAPYVVYAADETVTGKWIISALDVTCEADGDDTWTGHYYYPASGKNVNFLAYAPKAPASATVAAANTTVNAPQIVFTDYTVNTSADEDFTVAKQTQASGLVTLTFAHMLSKVDVQVTLDEKLTDFTLTAETSAAAELGVLLNKNTATLTKDGGSWGTAELDGSDVSYTRDLTATNNVATTVADDVKSMMILPQAGKGCTVTLSGLTIKDSEENVILDGTSSDKALGTYTLTETQLENFVAGTAYTIVVNITSAAKDEDGNPIIGSEIILDSTCSWKTGSDVGLNEDQQPDAK